MTERPTAASILSSFFKSRVPAPLFVLASVLLTASVIINVTLAESIRSFRTKLGAVEAESKLSEGTVVPDIEAKSVNGAIASYAFRKQKPTILYVFSPKCGWCEKNQANFKELVAKSQDFDIVGVSTSSLDLSDYVIRQGWTFPVFTDPSPETAFAFKFGATPQTIVISPTGFVEKSWLGAYQGRSQTEVENYFALKLPGLIK